LTNTFRMLEFIREQPEAVSNTLAAVQARLPEVRDALEGDRFDQVIVAGLGSSYTASQMASPLLRRCSPIPVFVTVASEVGLDAGLKLGPRSLVVLVSRSGERGRIVDALATAKAAGATCFAVTAVESSLLAQSTDLVLVTGEGPESTYAKTKSVMASAAALMQLGVALHPGGDESARLEQALANVPQLLATGIGQAQRDIERIREWLAGYRLALVTGTAGNQGVAMEASLKLQEAAGVVTEWDETGSALHGAVTILDDSWLYVGLATRADEELHRSVLELAGQFGAGRLCVVEPGVTLDTNNDELMGVPEADDPLIAPLLFLPPVQLLTYELALARGRNPDEPPFADVMLQAMLPPGRSEPDWRLVTAKEGQ
jgi:glutamine---fructose-6-phosphate transaminase (isomerizing)